MKKVCLVIGAGAGIGGSVGRKFAQEGYHAALCRRSDEEGLNKMVADIDPAGIELLDDQSRIQQLKEWNDTAVDYPKHQTLHGLFESQAVNKSQ